ncbi:MAG: pyruvate dehydrogenase (acetyl-transferring), homodimeric type [Halofilum sp. (in: g-proteobacteria)]|nr:pyruvate dehydrogenase (acetyl-transferring), homodimeric type [Halofilum sp. (in: g-proteobacteria)]
MADEHDIDTAETQEWLDSLDTVLEADGPERAHFLVERLIDASRRAGINIPFSPETGYVNTIPPHLEERSPGDHDLEWKLRSYVRWNATAMVVRANKKSEGIGGHIASFASAATLYDVGFNHFFRAPSHEHGGDLVFIQGHSAPGIYARAFMEGRLSKEKLDNFRHEVDGNGIPSYPHPWLMPDFWQFPTVSMGLAPMMGIYQARFMKYMHDRELASTRDRKVWVYMGDGEVDEPESLGAISLAGRERLDNLIYVVNCNLQRLDGPVRGNGKIIQELEAMFRGAGWNVIKVIWGSYWDPLLAQDNDGLLRKRMDEAVDGEYQTYKSKDGAYVREHFFGKYDKLKAMVSNMSDEDVWRLNRGGHDPHKVYAAYAAATQHKGQPTVILAKTVKGYGMGSAGEGQMIAHQQKKMDADDLKNLRDRFRIPISDEAAENAEYYHPGNDSEEIKYLHERRKALGGYLPQRKTLAAPLKVPTIDTFKPLLESSGDREMSTTMGFVRALTLLTRDKKIGSNVVPIVPDEARTFGIDGMFRQLGIYSPVGQLYTPEDAGSIMYYREDKKGQILEEGINEAGAFCDWLAAATAYSTHGVNMIPFYIFYSMFGFQRIGDFIWAGGDQQARGFLLGGTAGRTTLNGEGLQHEDGHSHLLSSTVPNCVSYDPCFNYELAVILQDGLRRMYQEQESVFYYITVMNENYHHPEMPKGVEDGIRKGMYRFGERKPKGGAKGPRVNLLGAGVIFREVIAAADLLRDDWGVASTLWSVTSFNELRKDGLDVERWNMLHPGRKQRTSWVEQCLGGSNDPVIASSDYMKAVSDQIRQFVPQRYRTLGTDGYGRSDTREALRSFFEVDRYWVTVAALATLAEEGTVDSKQVTEAIKKYGIDPEKPNPVTV